MRKLLAAGLGLIAVGWLAQVALRPAQVRAVEISRVSGVGPARICLRWSYEPGVRPISLIIDVVGPGAQSGSLTIGGQATSGEIALADAPSGPYQLTATATYRIVGVVRRHTQSFTI
jgi:hypothetical protein